eukprot:TRINITY_DN21546_c0_g1_i1.p1 TRINITY_DN21546_c0_g1~~TRINITY_DN21546_c0_g1_i1.p1  ORF type:complete len:306 (+),score=111.46 TRINITY_DN21546_c0_g1_i1:72-989(+)
MEEVTEKIEDLTVSDDPAGDLNFGGKKKKKKKQVEGGDGEEESAPTVVGTNGGGGGEEAGVDEDAEALELSLKKKKKKKKGPNVEQTSVEESVEAEGEGEGEGEGAGEVEGEGDGEVEDGDEGLEEDEPAEGIELGESSTRLPWEGSDRDYKYEELLDRVFRVLRANNPKLGGLKHRTVMKPPKVFREGTKKTVFVNLMDLCKTMHRSPEHVMTFLLAELGTNGSLDGQQRLTIKGRFQPKDFEGILRRYVNEYVMCSMCKSPDTLLVKENRLFFLRCEQCGSSRSVAPIKAGFVARVGRRKATS